MCWRGSVCTTRLDLPQFAIRVFILLRCARPPLMSIDLELHLVGMEDTDKHNSVVALDLHDPQYQGFFDIPMDNLYGRPLLQRYIQQNIPDYKDAVIVSPDAGGAKRATAIADSLGMEFALIHKVRRRPSYE